MKNNTGPCGCLRLSCLTAIFSDYRIWLGFEIIWFFSSVEKSGEINDYKKCQFSIVLSWCACSSVRIVGGAGSFYTETSISV